MEAEGSDEEVKTHCTEAVPLKKCHQEAKPDKDHHMDILETFRIRTEKGEEQDDRKWHNRTEEERLETEYVHVYSSLQQRALL